MRVSGGNRTDARARAREHPRDQTQAATCTCTGSAVSTVAVSRISLGLSLCICTRACIQSRLRISITSIGAPIAIDICYANLSLEKTKEAAARLRAGLTELAAGGVDLSSV